MVGITVGFLQNWQKMWFAVTSTDQAFAALKKDGSVVTWGNADYGGDKTNLSGVKEIFSAPRAFAALKKDGSVVTWGDPRYGGDSSGVDLSRQSKKPFFQPDMLLAALKTNGSVVTWGYDNYGGDSSSVRRDLSSRVVNIFSTDYAFAAVRSNGLVVTWGFPDYGGESNAVSRDLVGTKSIFSTPRAFAALKKDGSVVTWGQDSYGGDSSGVDADLEEGARGIVSTDYAFAVLKDDDSVVTWGRSQYGGDSSAVSEHLEGIIKGVSWTPPTSGKVGVPLMLDAVKGTLNGDTVSYRWVSGQCSFDSGTETAERTLKFTDGGNCVVMAVVERVGYDAWSLEKTISVAVGTLTGLSWTPSTNGVVGESLVLDDVTGIQQGDNVSYTYVSGECSFDEKKMTLTFSDAGDCIVKATVERVGLQPLETREIQSSQWHWERLVDWVGHLQTLEL